MSVAKARSLQRLFTEHNELLDKRLDRNMSIEESARLDCVRLQIDSEWDSLFGEASS